MAARPYRAWKGAIEFAGFPVNIALYSRIRSSNGGSFRQLSPAGNPIQQQLVDSLTGEVVDRAELQKGVEVAKGQYVPLTPEALEQIEAGTKTEVATPSQFVPTDTIDWTLASATYEVLPDKDVPGSEQAANIIWNGLRGGLAYVTQVSMRGAADVILAIRADDRGMWASTLPYSQALYENPEAPWTVNEEAAGLFAQVVETHYGDKLGAFERETYVSAHKARRDAAIESVLAGEPVKVEAPAPAPAAPDLMALMAAAAKTPKAKATPKAEKVTA